MQIKYDPKEIRKALKLFGICSNYVTELRALNVRDNINSNYSYTFGGYFDNSEALVNAVCNIQYASGIYFMPNPCHTDVLSRFHNRAVKYGKGESTKDNEIIRRKWLLIDADPTRLSRISSTDDEHKFAIDRVRDIAAYLSSKGWPAPIVADSGNGGHLVYPIDLPIDDDHLVENCLKALDKRFSDDIVKIDTSVYNPARIWKLYGTLACKGDNTPNRPHRMARILEVPDDY